MGNSFENIKQLEFDITLANPAQSFSSNGQSYNTINLFGLRASVNIENAGGSFLGTLKARIYGVSQSHMNQLTSLQWDNLLLGTNAPSYGFNLIRVYAVDGNQRTCVYNGTILNCWGDYSALPQVNLMVDAQVGYQQQVQAVSPVSIASNTNVDTVMSQIASQMGMSYQNSGVNQAVNKGLYLGNTSIEQARTMMRMYRFWMYVDASTIPNTLVIAPYGSPRKTTTVAPLISPSSGLMGYPLFSSSGINFETLFNPDILIGAPVQISSSLERANGNWIVTSVSHELSSQTDNGPWKSTVNAVPFNIGSPVGVA